jgi:hypothetical protein
MTLEWDREPTATLVLCRIPNGGKKLPAATGRAIGSWPSAQARFYRILLEAPEPEAPPATGRMDVPYTANR